VRPECTTVSFDDESLICRRPGGVVETLRWADLQLIFIETTDGGPAVDDVFWVLGSGESGLVLPSEAEGMSALLQRFQRLPNFDNNAVIAAMSCAERRTFICWRRSEAIEVGGAPSHDEV